MEEYGEAAFGCVDGGIEYIRADIARAEITKLRAELAEANGRIALRDGECKAKTHIIVGLERELEAERELADRLAGLLSRAPTKAVYMQLCIDALAAHAARRNK